MTEKPVPDDLLRDAVADLAVCEAATPGPWSHDLDSDDPDGGISGPCGGLVCFVQHHGNVNTVARTGEQFSHDDARLIAMSRTALLAWIRRATVAEVENTRLREAIAYHHGQKADDRCWMDDRLLYDAAGLPEHDDRVGDRFKMLANCVRFVDRRCSEGGPWKTYAELESENTRLREALLTFKRLAGAALIDPSEDGSQLQTVAEFVEKETGSKP